MAMVHRAATPLSMIRMVVLGGALMVLAGCAALPRSGPTSGAMPQPDELGLEGLVAPLTAEVAEIVSPPPPESFSAAFFAAPEIDPSRLGVGDIIDIAIWEGAERGILSGGVGPAVLEQVTVDDAGRVFIPYVGLVEAENRTIGQLRDRIRAQLEALTPNPQVDVRLREARSRSLTVQGAVRSPGVYVIEREITRLTPLLAVAGGASLPPEQTEVTIRRAGQSSAVMLDDLYGDPTLDVALAPRDTIVLNAIRERFVILGAAGVQREVVFPTRRLSLLRAIGAAGGLQDLNADPAGVFIFRWEEPAKADALLPGARPEGLPAGPGRPIVYQLDMTEPQALFTAQTFQLRDGDAIFIANAPLTELRKFLQLFSATVQPVQTFQTTGAAF
jgi:polysaccharide export outer membrane protein